jgi:hypothetical protein
MRGHHRVVHPEAALAVSAGITGITFAAVVAVMAVQHVSDQAAEVRNTSQTPAPTPTTTTTTPPPNTIIVQQQPQTQVVVITKDVPAQPAPQPPAVATTPGNGPQARDLVPATTHRHHDPLSEMMNPFPSFVGDIFDQFVH